MASSETLRSVIDAGRAGKRLDELSTARVIAKVAQQLHAAQQKAGAGKAVGPLSPARVSIAPSGEVSVDGADGARPLGYSAPEQVTGGAGDRKSDVFSLGVVLWEALTHQRLFEAMNDAAVAAAVQERPIASPSELNANIPAELSAICMRSLSRNPTDRYQSLKAMAVEIEEFLDEAGYADDDTKIAQFLKQLTPLATPAGSKPADTLPGPGPSILVAPTATDAARPKTASSSGVLLAAKLAGAAAPLPAATSASTSVGVPDGAAPVSAATAAPLSAATTSPGIAPTIATAATVAVPAVTPLPPVLPSGSDAALKTPKPVDDPKATIVEAMPVALINAAEDAMKGAAKAAAAPADAATPTTTATPAADSTPAADAVPTKQVNRETGPHPASVVSLPGRDSKADVLAGWGWGTGKHDALPPTYEDDDDLAQPRSSKKLLTYIIGGGLALALVITVIAFAAGGSSSATDKHRALARQNQEAVAKELAEPTPSAPVETGSGGSNVAAATGSDVGAVGAGYNVAPDGSGSGLAGSAQALSAADQAAADKAAADQAAADKAAADKAAADQAAADKAAAKQAAADQAAADKAAAKQAAADEAARKKAEADAKKQADAQRKADAKKAAEEAAAKKQADAAKIAKTDPKKRADKTTKTTTRTVATADVKKTDANGKPIEAETAYRQGLQAFARGDNAGAITSLRSAVAANPSYAPTYRGLGLVYEKMGEKDAAKVAYKKYLQLAPNAGDAEIIRGRLERLGS